MFWPTVGFDVGEVVGLANVGTGVGPRVVGEFDGALVGAKGQNVAATRLLEPASAFVQALHAPAESEPMRGLYVPAAQDTQLADVMDPLDSRYLPAGQGTHAEAPRRSLK